MEKSINVMVNKICSILEDNVIAIYLYGSVTLNDFKLGWSDIDILCLTKEPVTDDQAEQLVNLRQILTTSDEKNQYYRSFEGVIVSIDEFKKNKYTKVVYWGTSGQRITDRYMFDVFSLFELIKYGQLLYGKDVRHELVLPTFEELKYAVQKHYETIRKYAAETDSSLYSCGWLLDIARCVYTLRHNDIISKTKAGEWAIQEKLCPEESQMRRALQIRNNPTEYKNKEEVKAWLCSLGESVQLFADVLEKELERINNDESIFC